MILKSIIKSGIQKIRKIGFINQFVTRLFILWYGAAPVLDREAGIQNIETLFSQHYKMPFKPTHFYSPLPDIDLVKTNIKRWYHEGSSEGIDWNIAEQLYLLKALEQFNTENRYLPDFDTINAQGFGHGYGEVEAHILYRMIRHFKPKKIIEVGSGVSSFFMLKAIQENNKTNSTKTNLICIEPYSTTKLIELAEKRNLVLHQSQVQDIDISLFKQLSENDILFIDSSHISKKDSDVDYLYLEVLPNLSKDVIIQIHDMPFPFPAIPKEHYLFDTYLFWNESALVKAFLLFNKAVKVIMCQSFLHYNHPEELKKVIEIYDPRVHFPSSLWLKKMV